MRTRTQILYEKNVPNRSKGRVLINSTTAATVNVILLLIYRLLYLILPLKDRRALCFRYKVQNISRLFCYPLVRLPTSRKRPPYSFRGSVVFLRVRRYRGADKSLPRPDWKKNWKVASFRPTRRSLLPRRPGWTDKLLIFFFWVACRSKFGCCRLFPSWSG